RATCSASRSTLRPAERPTTSKRSGNASTMRRQLVPTEPVEPRMERPRVVTFLKRQRPRAGPLKSVHVEEVIVQKRSAEEQTVHPVQHPAVAREQRSGVLHSRPPLHQALRQVTD